MNNAEQQNRATNGVGSDDGFGEVCVYRTRRAIHHFMLDGQSDLLCRRVKPGYLELIDVLACAEAKAMAQEPANARYLCPRCETKMRNLSLPNAKMSGGNPSAPSPS